MGRRTPCDLDAGPGRGLGLNAAPTSAAPESLVIPTGRAVVVHARAWEGVDAAKRSVVILGALAAPQRYLRHLAGWLHEQGYGVLTFDYRGVGASIHGANANTNLDDWAVDVSSALSFAREHFATRRLLVLGHSIGGMLLGHAGVPEVDGALLLASTLGRPGFYRGRARLRLEAAYRFLPRIAGALGELPGWPFLLGTRVPRDVIRQWVAWGKRGEFHRWNGAGSEHLFARLRGPLIGVRISDDDYAPAPAVDALLERYRAAGWRRELLDAAALGGPIGHFGLFGSEPVPAARLQVLRWLQELEAASD